MSDNLMVAVYEVGPQGVLVDTGTRTYLDDAKHMIESGSYSFKKHKEYVCLPFFVGSALRTTEAGQ